MAEEIKQERPREKGEVRIRSNVCTDPDAWHLVPGDVARNYGLQGQLNKEQHNELMYYEPCAVCRRTIFFITEDGCDYPICRQQGIMSHAEAARRKSRYSDSSETA